LLGNKHNQASTAKRSKRGPKKEETKQWATNSKLAARQPLASYRSSQSAYRSPGKVLAMVTANY